MTIPPEYRPVSTSNWGCRLPKMQRLGQILLVVAGVAAITFTLMVALKVTVAKSTFGPLSAAVAAVALHLHGLAMKALTLSALLLVSGALIYGGGRWRHRQTNALNRAQQAKQRLTGLAFT